MHLHRADAASVAGLLSLADADQLITASGIRTPAIRVAKNGSVLPDARFTQTATLAGKPITGLIDPRKLFALFDDGATIVFQGLHRYWPPLTDLIERLESELGHPCQANAYLTPPGAQGFAVHADTHDVFVFQTAGTKEWEIHGLDGPEQVVLEPGLCVYLPTGTKHAARAQERLSLHVTVGVNQRTLRGLVRRTVADALNAVPDRHLPAGFLQDPALLTEGLAAELERLAARIRAIDPAAAADTEARRMLTTRPSRLRGGLLDRDALARLTDETPLRRRPGHVLALRDHGDRLQVLLGDRVLDVPGRLRPAMDSVCRVVAFAPKDLSGSLDAHDRIVLCRRLVREGLLEIVEPVPDDRS